MVSRCALYVRTSCPCCTRCLVARDCKFRRTEDPDERCIYSPQPATCFIITDPKRREVFAAQFRDLVVHQLYYSYAVEMLERTFIQDIV